MFCVEGGEGGESEIINIHTRNVYACGVKKSWEVCYDTPLSRILPERRRESREESRERA